MEKFIAVRGFCSILSEMIVDSFVVSLAFVAEEGFWKEVLTGGDKAASVSLSYRPLSGFSSLVFSCGSFIDLGFFRGTGDASDGADCESSSSLSIGILFLVWVCTSGCDCIIGFFGASAVLIGGSTFGAGCESSSSLSIGILFLLWVFTSV